MDAQQQAKRGIAALWIAALAFGASYFIVRDLQWPLWLLIGWKGAGVGLLAAWAASQARSTDGWMLAGVMALGALGDVLIEAAGLTAGAIAFLAGHLLAIGLYLRNRRATLSFSQRALALLLVPAVVWIAWSLPTDRSAAPGIALYALGLAAMAAAAWTSRFPRYRTGMGAMLFVASDLLIFARLGPMLHSPWPDLLVWPSYFIGQALIARGVVTTLVARSN